MPRPYIRGFTLIDLLVVIAIAVREWRPQDPAVQNLRPEFAPRGGLGLVLYPLSAASAG
jgi:hypothetical protein